MQPYLRFALLKTISFLSHSLSPHFFLPLMSPVPPTSGILHIRPQIRHHRQTPVLMFTSSIRLFFNPLHPLHPLCHPLAHLTPWLHAVPHPVLQVMLMMPHKRCALHIRRACGRKRVFITDARGMRLLALDHPQSSPCPHHCWPP